MLAFIYFQMNNTDHYYYKIQDCQINFMKKMSIRGNEVQCQNKSSKTMEHELGRWMMSLVLRNYREFAIKIADDPQYRSH